MSQSNTNDPLALLVDPSAQLVRLGDGFEFTEGPVWHTEEQSLHFSDIPGDARWRWTERDGMELVMRPAFKPNGQIVDTAGDIVVCEQLTSTVTKYRSDGTSQVLAFHCGGVYLNSPNDIVVRSADGSIYFTDPDYGRWNDWIGCQRTPLLGFKSVMRIPASGGEAEPMTAPDEFDQPNGLCFSPDETLLYVNDSPRAHVKVFEVRADGTLANGRVFFEHMGSGSQVADTNSRGAGRQVLHDSGAVDGMKCDERGNVWVTGPGGVWIISADGVFVGLLPTPEVAGNLAWGGSDLRSLFVTTSTSVHMIQTLVGPAPLPHFATAAT